MKKHLYILIVLIGALSIAQAQNQRQRARDLGIEPGILTPGKYNAITDVQGVSVGQKTLIVGDSIRRGISFRKKYPQPYLSATGLGKHLGLHKSRSLAISKHPLPSPIPLMPFWWQTV